MAGFSQVKITPPLGTPLGGNVRDKGAQGIHDDLFARTVVFSDGKEEIALACCALIGIPGEMVEKIRKISERLCRIPGKNIQVAASHTHSGPETGIIFDDVNEAYLNHLSRLIAQSIAEAKEDLAEVNLYLANGEEYALCNNRRIWMKDGKLRMNWEKLNPEEVKGPAGPVDPEVGVLVVQGKDGAPRGMLINYTCHPAILAGDNFLVSEDYPGYALRLVKDQTGALCLFTNGAAGDINHINVFDPFQRRGFYEARRLGTLLSRKVVSLIGESDSLCCDRIGLLHRKIKLPLRSISPEEVENAKRVLQEKPVRKISLVDGISEEIYAEQVLALSRVEEKTLETEIDLLSLGDQLALVSIPGELFVEYGLRIKKGSPFPYTYVIGASGIADRRTIPPTYLHHPQTLKAARTGKHILCEKPMALNLSQAEEMIRVCQENGVKLTCWYPPIERAWRQQVELGGTPPCYPPELGLHNLRIVLVAYESAK